MTTFVIKNKEGKYYEGLSEKWYDSLDRCTYLKSKESAEYEKKLLKLKNCEIIEITVAEGDLLQKIGELKDYIYSYNNEINYRPQVCNEYIDATCKDILYKMKELKL